MNDNEASITKLQVRRPPWNKGKLIGTSGYTMDRATIRQKKTGRPVRFELTDQTRQALDDYLRFTGRKSGQYLFLRTRRQGRPDHSTIRAPRSGMGRKYRT